VDWEKVGSSYACPPVEMAEFFKKAKEYAPKLVSLIIPPSAPLTIAPGSSTPSSRHLLLRLLRLLLPQVLLLLLRWHRILPAFIELVFLLM
jgi:hypothetical protein